MGRTAHQFVTEMVTTRLTLPPSDLENMCQIAVLAQIDGISAEQARRAVLAVHAALAYFTGVGVSDD